MGGLANGQCLQSGLDMTPKQAGDVERKAFAAEVGRIILELSKRSNGDDDSRLENKWLLEFANKSGNSQATAYSWWTAFTKDTGRDCTPKKATADQPAIANRYHHAARNRYSRPKSRARCSERSRNSIVF